MADHTKEPWFIAGSAPSNLFGDPVGSEIVTAGGYSIVKTSHIAILNGWHLKPGVQHWGIDDGGHIDLEEGEAEANAQRIVDCVNALEGIANPASIKDVVKALRWYAEDHERPNEGPWGVSSDDFGKRAQEALAKLDTAPNQEQSK